MKTILAIIEVPGRAKSFIRYVANMAADLKTDVHLLNVLSVNKYPIGVEGSTGLAASQVQQNIQSSAENAKDILNGLVEDVLSEIEVEVSISSSSQPGGAFQIAREMVSEGRIGMVVLEGQKDKSFWDLTSGNIEIIESVECPVWIIPDNIPYQPYNKLIYATDYKEEDIKGLTKLIALTRPFAPSVTALHITNSVDFEEKVKQTGFINLLKKKVAYDDLSVKVIKENTNKTAELLNDFALQTNANLIVVLRENKSFFERIFKSDTAKKIIKKSVLPVLVFHGEE